ncbi:hypothetical protein DMN50_36775, partial [Priestia megaterium]
QLITLLNELTLNPSVATSLSTIVQNLSYTLTTRVSSSVELMQTLVDRLNMLIKLLCLNSETRILLLEILTQIEVILVYYPTIG